MVRNFFSSRQQVLFSVIWLTGLVILAWGFSGLYLIFSQERDNTSTEIISRQKALEQYAFLALTQSLQQQLSFVRSGLVNTLRDPLVDNQKVLYFGRDDEKGAGNDGLTQLLPRPVIYKKKPKSNQSAEDLFHTLLDADPVDLISDYLSPWNVRLNLLGDFKLAVESQDATAIRWAFRYVREHRARSPLPGDLDIPYVLALVEYLITFSSPEKALVKNIIRNGSVVDREYGYYGLQRSLIAARHLVSKRDFEFFRDKIVALSALFDVEYADFLQQSNIGNIDTGLDISKDYHFPLVLNNQWYIEKQKDGNVLGVSVDLNMMVSGIEEKMKTAGLLDSQAVVGLKDMSASIVEINEGKNILSVRYTGVDERLNNVTANFGIKTLLLFSGTLLVVSIAILIILGQIRKQRYLSLKSDFIATVSHELKTPLASIRLLTETLSKKAANDGKLKDYPARIIKTADEMSYLVNNILSFNRLNKKLWQLIKTPICVGEVISSLKPESGLYTDLPVNITLKGLKDIEINADRGLLKILFGNLINNACKYNNSDSVEIEITVSKGKYFTVEVADNGAGIPEKKWEAVFEEFFRVMGAGDRTVSGAGLGLSICKIIMKLHHGTIKILKSSNHGTVFQLIFYQD